jgi:hypothetical protein
MVILTSFPSPPRDAAIQAGRPRRRLQRAMAHPRKQGLLLHPAHIALARLSAPVDVVQAQGSLLPEPSLLELLAGFGAAQGRGVWPTAAPSHCTCKEAETGEAQVPSAVGTAYAHSSKNKERNE